MQTFHIPIAGTAFDIQTDEAEIIRFISNVYASSQLPILKNDPLTTITISYGPAHITVDITKKMALILTPEKSPNLPLVFDMVRSGVSQFLPLHDALLLHASVVVSDNQAYIFSGPVGAGKSTIRKLLNAKPCYGDDTAVLKRETHGWVAYPSPLYESSQRVYEGKKVPIKGIYFIYQNKNQLTRLPLSTAYIEVVRGLKHYLNDPFTIHSTGVNNLEKHVTNVTNDLCEQIARSIPCYSLGFSNNNLAFWDLVRYTR